MELVIFLFLFNLFLNYILIFLIDDENNIEETAEIVIMGLTYLIPMITADLLKYPDFCLQYYKTLIFFIETRSHKVSNSKLFSIKIRF